MSATHEPDHDRLSTYRAKRSAGATPEPVGTVTPSAGHLFVVHKHAAKRLHYDLRLEMRGVLESWAVPKGPSMNPADKRLAVKVEDHPLEYGDFEGMIPEGNYGAGAVVLWDRGLWIPLEDVDEGFEKGKLLFDLRGYKLRGRWTLVKIKKSEKDWLLIKERDHLATDEDGTVFPEGSVMSGLTVEDLAEGVDPGAAIRGELEDAGVLRQRVDPGAIDLMLAQAREEPFSKPGWVFEIKLDGYRMVASVTGGKGRLRTRNGHDATPAFPEVERALRALPFRSLVLDGELVVHDTEGLPSFQRLQKRARLSRVHDVRKAAVEHPATLYLFDILGFEDFDLRSLPLIERKALLKRVLPPVGPIKFADHLDEQGEEFYEQVEKMGLEGMVAKRADSTYQGRRSADWIKVRADRHGDFVIVGFTEPKGSRGGFGALHLAAYQGEELVYVGRVGSGFATAELDSVRETLESVERDDAPCSKAPKGKSQRWVDPVIVCEVRFKEWTDEALLRHSVFQRFRDDKNPRECEHPANRSDEGPEEVFAQFDSTSYVGPELQFTNQDKLFWPADGYTKGDLIDYYRSVAKWILPYLRDRPVVMTRFPDGIDGKSFFQKDAPGFAPEWIRREAMWSEDTERDINYFVADTEESLLYIINLASIPLHIWASRVATLEQPDWCVIDLDPGEAPFGQVVEIAQALHRVCDEIELPNFVKTTGKTGLHVLVPLGRELTFDQTKAMGELLARVVMAELPEIATIARLPAHREGKVYVDYLQNGRGKLIVSPFCVRPLDGAPVSMPLAWDEVNDTLDVRDHTIKNAPERMATLGEDLMRPVIELKPDLHAVLERLGRMMG